MKVTIPPDDQGIYIEPGQPGGILKIAPEFCIVTKPTINKVLLLTRQTGKRRSYKKRLAQMRQAAKFIGIKGDDFLEALK